MEHPDNLWMREPPGDEPKLYCIDMVLSELSRLTPREGDTRGYLSLDMYDAWIVRYALMRLEASGFS